MAHAWNAVRTSKGWYLYDPTWSSGTVDGNFQFVKDLNDTWYKVLPREFILTHIPFDPIWQLLNPPLSNHQIKANDFSLVKSNVRSCAELLETIKSQEPDAIRYIAELKTKISETEKSISEEDGFVTKYLLLRKNRSGYPIFIKDNPGIGWGLLVIRIAGS